MDADDLDEQGILNIVEYYLDLLYDMTGISYSLIGMKLDQSIIDAAEEFEDDEIPEGENIH